jgi:phosphate transport system permease protein
LSRSHTDFFLFWTTRTCALLASGIVGFILVFLLLESWPTLHAVGLGRFLHDPSWHPAGEASTGFFNLTPMLAATVFSTAGAVLLAVPLGISSALFCRFYAPWPLSTAYRGMMGLLAGIPSVVYGFWGLVVLTPLLQQWQPPGHNLLAGILILTLMILPTVTLLSESSLHDVPRHYTQGAVALGLSRWAMIRGVMLPAAREGILTAILLATGRAIGETMAVMMVTGNVVQVPGSLFDPVRTLTANIALELGYAMDHHRGALFVSGLLLMMLTVIFVGWAGRGRKIHVF